MLTIEKQFEASENERDRELQRYVADLAQQGKKSITLDELKVALAKTAMQLRTQRELALNPPPGSPQVAKPGTEPPRRAPSGQAFQR
jgi:hypothetical protein